jgi:DegV family protein with EDD domain
MRVGIAIDVSTDVSHEFVTENNIFVLPSTLRLGKHSMVYGRDPDSAREFYRLYSSNMQHDSETIPLSVKEVEDLFLSKLVLEYDYIFLITLSSTHSQTYDNAHKASFTILQSYTAVRETRDVLGPFALRVVDSQNLFAGPGVLAWEAVRMVREQITPGEIRKRLDELAPHIYNFTVPFDLVSLRARGAQRGDDSINWVRYTLGTLFDIKPVIRTNRSMSVPIATIRHFDKAVEKVFAHGMAQIRRGLLVPMMGVSYGGDTDKLRAMPGFAEFSKVAAEHGVELMLSLMSPAAAINVGAGAVSLAYCSRNSLEFSS